MLEPDDRGLDFLEYGPDMSRGLRALKVWMVLRFFGQRGLRGVLQKSLALARHLHGLVLAHPDFEVLHEPILYPYCFRYVPRGLVGRDEPALRERLDRLNQQIAEVIQQSGLALVMTTRVRGRIALRMSICSQRTLEEDIDATFEALAQAGERLASEAGLGPQRVD